MTAPRVNQRVLLLALAALAAAIPAGCGGSSSSPEFVPGLTPPANARAVAGRLAAPNKHTVRHALTPALAAITPAGSAFPQGTRIELDAKGWRQSGNFATSTGVLLIRHKPPQHVEIGFVQTHFGWHITFMEKQ
jgi:hypothetical protein